MAALAAEAADEAPLALIIAAPLLPTAGMYSLFSQFSSPMLFTADSPEIKAVSYTHLTLPTSDLV